MKADPKGSLEYFAAQPASGADSNNKRQRVDAMVE